MTRRKMQECFEPADLQQLIMMAPGQIVIIDVRSPDEFKEKHIPAAINIPLAESKVRPVEFSGRQ